MSRSTTRISAWSLALVASFSTQKKRPGRRLSCGVPVTFQTGDRLTSNLSLLSSLRCRFVCGRNCTIPHCCKMSLYCVAAVFFPKESSVSLHPRFFKRAMQNAAQIVVIFAGLRQRRKPFGRKPLTSPRWTPPRLGVSSLE